MILYHGITTYHILQFIIHKLSRNRGKEAILLIPDFVEDKYSKIISSNIFDEIIVMPYRNINYKDKKLNETIIKNCIKRLDNHNKLSNFEEIHVAGAHFYFTQFLFDNNVPFYYYEEASGILTNSDILKNIVKRIDTNQHKWALENGMFDGNNDLVIKKICNMKAQDKGFYDEKALDFDIIEEYFKLTLEEQSNIRSLFIDIDNIDIAKESTLFLTQHFVNLNMLTFEEHILIYQIVIDYFFKNKEVVFKPHPDDIMYYSRLFPKSKVIREKFPSEFLPSIFTEKPDEIATITSTAINNLYPYFDKVFTLDIAFEKYFKSTHKYYAAIKLVKELKSKSIKYLGSNKMLINNIINHSDIEFESIDILNLERLDFYENCTYIIDDIKDFKGITEKDIINLIDNLAYNSNIIFINSDEDYCFYDYEFKYIWDNITPVCINKKIVKFEEVYENNNEEAIYFYSKDKEHITMAESLTYEKELENTGVEVSIANLTEDQRRIKVLEGILRATEKRLLHYIKLVEESEK